MGNFGHIPISGHLGKDRMPFRMDSWGAGPFFIRIDGKRWGFEDSDMFGPVILRKNLSIADRQPGEKSVFWRGYGMWRKGGRRLRGGKVCVWAQPRLGTYWKDKRGNLHFLTDPDLPTYGPNIYLKDYIEVNEPTSNKSEENE